MITCVDLFCGIGGLTHGLKRGGIDVKAGVDVDPECRFPYETNNGATFIEMDVRNLTESDVASLWGNGAYKLLAGCAPCQAFSTYSRSSRRNMRSKWERIDDFGRLVRETKPDFVTMENVPSLMKHEAFGKFVKCLDGYWVWTNVVDSWKYGVPQTRRRLVLLASRLGPISLSGPTVEVKSDAVTVRQVISHLRPLAAGESDPSDSLHTAPKLSELNLERIRASRPGGSWRDWNRELVARCHRGKSGHTYPSVYGRMVWDDAAPTITTQCFGYGNGRFGHPEQDRAISLREAALLQTFPQSYQFLHGNERPRFNVLGRLIGNAVPVRLGEVLAKSLLQHVALVSG